MRRPSAERWFDRLALAGAVLLYAVLALRRLDVPIPRYDEAEYAPQALEILSSFAGGSPRHWPLMVSSYVGCPMSYVIAPFIAVWGLRVETLRLPAIGVALAAVLIFLFLISRIFPRLPLWAPAAACLLDSTFLISSRTGLYVDVSIHWLLLSLTLLCLWRWSLTRRPRHAFLAFLCVGFGIYSKIIFVWFAFPAALAVAYFSRREGRAARARLAGVCALGLLIGSLPLLIFNLRHRWKTARMILDHLIQPNSPAAASNLSLLQNLAARGRHLLMMFNGGFLYPADRLRTLSGAVFLILFAAGFFAIRKKAQRAALAVAGAFIAALFFGSTLTISTRQTEHLYPILPLMLLLAGVALAKLLPRRLPLLLACALLLIPQVRHFNLYIEGMAFATDEHSPRALSSLSSFLTAAGVARPTALDWGISYPLLVASGGKVAPEEDFDDDALSSLAPGSTAICYWTAAPPGLQGCGRLLRSDAFVLGETRKFPDAPDAPVYAAIRVLGKRHGK